MKVIAIVSLVTLLSACSATPPTVSPTNPTATGTQTLVNVLNTIAIIAVAASPIDGIPAADNALIQKAIPGLVAIAQAAKTGWVSVVDTGLNDLLPLLTPATQATLGPYFNGAQVIFGVLYSLGLS